MEWLPGVNSSKQKPTTPNATAVIRTEFQVCLTAVAQPMLATRVLEVAVEHGDHDGIQKYLRKKSRTCEDKRRHRRDRATDQSDEQGE